MTKSKDPPIRTSCLECCHRSWVAAEKDGRQVRKLKCAESGIVYDMIFGEGGFECLPVMCMKFANKV